MEAFHAGEIDKAISHADENVVIHEVSCLPWGGYYTGREGLKKIMVGIGAQFTEVKLVFEHLGEFGDNGLISIARLVGTAKLTGARIDEYFHELLFFDGPDPTKFTFARVAFNDDVRILRALGYDSLPDQRVPNPF